MRAQTDGSGDDGTGHALRTIDAARLLGLGDPDRFLVLAKRAGVVGVRGKHGHLFWSEEKVERVRPYLDESTN